MQCWLKESTNTRHSYHSGQKEAHYILTPAALKGEAYYILALAAFKVEVYYILAKGQGLDST